MKIVHHDSLMKAELVSARFSDIIKIRFPWLVVGLVGALLASYIVSRFELSLRENIALSFFIPVIAYMSDSIGNQTETILIRALANLKFDITMYVVREMGIGALLGFLFGILSSVFAYIVSMSLNVALVVGVSLCLSMTVATALACLTPVLLRFLGKDPAVGSGPFSTALQDITSLSIYLVVASLLL